MKTDAKTRAPAGHRRRLRDRYAKAGLAGFHDYEALELLLTFAIPRCDVKPAAKAVIARFKTLRAALEASEGELTTVVGIGERAAGLVGFVREAAIAYLSEAAPSALRIASPQDAVLAIRASRGAGAKLAAESAAAYLNSKNEVLSVVESGAQSPYTAECIKAIIEEAVNKSARSIIFARFARLTPKETASARSSAAALAQAASALDIILHDYIVIEEDKHLSAREKGWLKG